MPMYVNSDSVKAMEFDRVYVGENLVYKKEYKYEEIALDANNSKAGVDSGVEYKPTGDVCTLKKTYRSTIKLRITFEAIADKRSSSSAIIQETRYPDSTFTNGTWTKEFTFKKTSPGLTLIKNDASTVAFTRLNFYYHSNDNRVVLYLSYENGKEDNPILDTNVYIKVIKVEQYV